MQNKPRKSNETNFMTLLDFIVDPAVIVDEKGHILIINNALEEMTGFSTKEVIGKSFLEMSNLSAESKAILLKNLMKRIEGLPVEPYEVNFTDKMGKARYVEVKAKKIDYAGQPADLVIFRDITRRKENARRLKEYSEKMEALANDKVKEVKKSTQKLKESEEKYRKQFEEALDAIFVADAETGIIIDCNRAASELVGREKSELVGEHQRILHPPEEIEGEFSRTFKQHLKEKEGQILEAQVITKRGEIKDVAIKASVFELRGKKLIQGIFRDITKGKRREERLLESEERLRNLYENIPDSLCVFVGREGHLLEYNKAFKKRTGYTDEELKDKTFLDFVYPDDRAMILKKYRTRYPEEELPLVFEMREVNKKGEALPTEVSVSTYKKKGRVIGIEVLHRDITERKKAEAKLLASEKKYRRLFKELKRAEKQLLEERDRAQNYLDIADVILIALDTEGHITMLNRKGCAILKCKAKEALGKNWFDTFLPKKVKSDVKRRFKLILTGKASFSEYHENPVLAKNGDIRLIGWHHTVLRNNDGRIIGTLSSGEDITERKIMQNKLAEYSQKLEKLVEKRTKQLKQTQAKLVKSERLATIGELAAMVGHDLRNPLTGIMGAAYYLKTKHGAELGAKGNEMLETLEKAINYSNKIINDLLEYSRDLKLKLTETTPKAMLQSALSLLGVPEKIQVVDATENEPMVKADTEKIRKVFVNIIQNAIEAMPEGGTLTIKSRKVKGKLEIAFKDTGAGMPEETLSNLKGGVPLFTTKAKGMGFGLPICRRLAEAHGGKISVESKIKKGTTVTVKIPVNPEPENEGEEKWIFNESMLTAITTTQRAP